MTSHSALKEHAETLEAALAKKESSAAALSSRITEELTLKEKELTNLRHQLKEIQQLTDAERIKNKDLKKQVTKNGCIYTYQV